MSPLLNLSVFLSDELDPEIEENLTPGWVGALVILGLIAVTILLWLSMRRQFRKIRFDQDEPGSEAAREETPDEDGRTDRG
jgi:hypothetical protein